MKRAFLATILALNVHAAELQPHHSRLFRWSLIALAATNGADAASSIGMRELNPVLSRGGNFTVGSAGLKLGIVGAVILTEVLAVRKYHEAETPVAITNFIMSGVAGGVAARNWRNH